MSDARTEAAKANAGLLDQEGPAIEVKGLRSAFGDHVVHENLDLTVRRGEVLGVVGGSGSGKSVLLNTIIGLRSPDAGTITVFGQPAANGNPRIGYVPQLRSQAGQASCSASCSRPGSSDQGTATQRLLAWLMGGGSGPAWRAAISPVPAGSSSGGADEQPASVPRMASHQATGPATRRAVRARPWYTRGDDKRSCMSLILLEALLALIILIVIVWWTMFAGRKKGELPPGEDRKP